MRSGEQSQRLPICAKCSENLTGYIRSGAICAGWIQAQLPDVSSSSGRNLKSLVSRFVRNESGDSVFDDGFTAFVVAIGFVASLYFIMATLGGVYDGVGRLLNAATH
jgi:Flp pilus assembly pilin Flp